VWIPESYESWQPCWGLLAFIRRERLNFIGGYEICWRTKLAERWKRIILLDYFYSGIRHLWANVTIICFALFSPFSYHLLPFILPVASFSVLGWWLIHFSYKVTLSLLAPWSHSGSHGLILTAESWNRIHHFFLTAIKNIFGNLHSVWVFN
jgi:hypothetical protein